MPWRRRPEPELQRVYREHVDAVYAFLAYSLPRHEAEDVTGATFEKVIKGWSRYDPAKASERTWIMSIARNALVDHHRRESHRRTVSTDEHPGLVESLAADEDWTSRRLEQEELRSWLARLSDRDREVLALRYAADMTAEAIGELLDLTTDNVHQISSRALRRLREAARRG